MNNNSIPWLQALLALWRAPKIGCATLVDLMQRYEDLTKIFRLPKSQLQHLGLKPEAILYLHQPDWKSTEQDLLWLEQPGHHLIHYLDQRYPALLKEIASSPPLLFVKGDPNILACPQLAIVGSRNPTPLGCDTAVRFSDDLSQLGLTITSGLALGIDAAAHRGALQANGKTIAVLGCGADQIYPKRHQALAEQIVENDGAIVSEFPTGVKALAEHFPRRNRIVSGLSFGTLVVEATLRSGSLITARLAAEQGRDVFAIPGSVHSPLSRGCHYLLRQGAKLVENIDDIVEELAAFTALYQEPKSSSQPNKTVTRLDDDCQMLLEYIGFEVLSADGLVAKSGLSPQQLAPKLFTLELQGLIKTVTGGYIRC